MESLLEKTGNFSSNLASIFENHMVTVRKHELTDADRKRLVSKFYFGNLDA